MVQKAQKEKKEKFSIITKGPIDYFIFILVVVLVACGLIMVLSASAPSALAEDGDSYTYIKQQSKAAIIGFIAMLGISLFDYHIYKKLRWLIYLGCVAILFAVGFLGVDAGRSKTMDINRESYFSAIRTCKNRFNCIFCCISF